jgi:CsoR family transcriptional regulator, copper-sensing transcriptional repressor
MQTEVRKKIISRLKRIEGQVRGVQRMIEEEADCGEILNQITAIKSAAHQAGVLMFENHVQDCIVKSLRVGEPEQNMDDLIKVMGRFIK